MITLTFLDENSAPIGYITPKDLSEILGVQKQMVCTLARQNKYDFIKIGRQIYIRDNERLQSLIDFYKKPGIPDGYISVKDLSEKLNVKPATISQMAIRRKFNFVKIGWRLYIRDDDTLKSFMEKRIARVKERK